MDSILACQQEKLKFFFPFCCKGRRKSPSLHASLCPYRFFYLSSCIANFLRVRATSLSTFTMLAHQEIIYNHITTQVTRIKEKKRKEKKRKEKKRKEKKRKEKKRKEKKKKGPSTTNSSFPQNLGWEKLSDKETCTVNCRKFKQQEPDAKPYSLQF